MNSVEIEYNEFYDASGIYISHSHVVISGSSIHNNEVHGHLGKLHVIFISCLKLIYRCSYNGQIWK